jgi:predicted ATPase
VVPEAAREIIAKRKARGLSPRPEPLEFARSIFREDIRRYEELPLGTMPVFFDRCLLDSMGMLTGLDQLGPDERRQHLDQFPYFPAAFILPPWREIYCTDTERDQTFDQAVAVHDSLRRWYVDCGYRLIEVPKASIDVRCGFVLQTLEAMAFDRTIARAGSQ